MVNQPWFALRKDGQGVVAFTIHRVNTTIIPEIDVTARSVCVGISVIKVHTKCGISIHHIEFSILESDLRITFGILDHSCNFNFNKLVSAR